jgi:hypothetical protein
MSWFTVLEAVWQYVFPLCSHLFSDRTPIVRQFIFRTICIMTRYQDDLELLARRSKIDFTQTRASSHPVATSNR